jgi:hypothetical protein
MLRYAFRIFAVTFRKYCGLSRIILDCFRICFGLFRICTASVPQMYRFSGRVPPLYRIVPEMFQGEVAGKTKEWGGGALSLKAVPQLSRGEK